MMLFKMMADMWRFLRTGGNCPFFMRPTYDGVPIGYGRVLLGNLKCISGGRTLETCEAQHS